MPKGEEAKKKSIPVKIDELLGEVECMNLRFTIGVCAVVAGVFSVSLCQPPTPRIANSERPADVIVSSINATTQDTLFAFESEEPAVQVRDLEGRLSNFSRRMR